MNYFNEMMNEPDDTIYDDIASNTERRLLTIGLCLSYIACLAALWLISALPGQTHAFFPDIFGLANQSESIRFSLLVVPLFVLCACYFRLRRMTGKIMQLPERKLDERQRLVRDRAHRIAYRIIAVLCLVILAYICIHNMLVTASPPPAPAVSETPYVQPAFSYIFVNKGLQTWSIVQKQGVLWESITPLQPKLVVFVQQSAPAVSAIPTGLLGLGLLYGLFLLTMILIVKTLPTAIIGWKERG
jgi:hypothetical protein